jgi:hypothetical protein
MGVIASHAMGGSNKDIRQGSRHLRRRGEFEPKWQAVTVVQPARCWRLASTRERWEKTGVSKDAYVNGPGVGFGAVHAAGACRDRRRTGPARAGPRLGMWGRRADALYECGEMMVRFMGRGTSRKEHVWEDEVRSWTRR